MKITVPKTELDADKQQAIDDLKLAFKETRMVIDKLELDFYSKDTDTQMSSIWVAGQLAMRFAKAYSEVNEIIDAGAEKARAFLEAEKEGSVVN